MIGERSDNATSQLAYPSGSAAVGDVIGGGPAGAGLRRGVSGFPRQQRLRRHVPILEDEGLCAAALL